MPVKLTRKNGSTSGWHSSIELAKSGSSVKSLLSKSSSAHKSAASSKQSNLVDARDDDDCSSMDALVSLDRSEEPNKNKGLKPLRSIRRKSEPDFSDSRDDDEEEGQGIKWGVSFGLFSDDRDTFSYGDPDDVSLTDSESEEEGGLFGLFATPMNRGRSDEDDSTESVSTDDYDDNFWNNGRVDDEGSDDGSDDGSDKQGPLSKGIAMTRTPSYFEKLYRKRHGELGGDSSSVMSTDSYLQRFSRKMDVPLVNEGSLSEIDEEASLDEEVDEPSKEGNSMKKSPSSFSRLTKDALAMKRTPSYVAHLVRRRRNERKKSTKEELSLESSLKKSVPESSTFQGEEDKSTVPTDIIVNDVPTDTSISNLVSMISTVQTYENIELQVGGTSCSPIDNNPVLESFAQAAKSDEYEQQRKREEEELKDDALVAAYQRERKTKKDESKRITAKQTSQQKVLKAEKKRLQVEKKKQRQDEERAAAAAAAEAKRMKAEETKRRAEEEKARKAKEKKIAAAAAAAAAEAKRVKAEENKRLAEEEKARKAEEKRAAADAVAEDKRLEAEEKKRLAEEEKARKAEEKRAATAAAAAAAKAKQVKAEEAKRLAEEEKARKAEEKRAAAAAAAEDKRIKAQENKRLAEEEKARKAEEKRAAAAAAAEAKRLEAEEKKRLVEEEKARKTAEAKQTKAKDAKERLARKKAQRSYKRKTAKAAVGKRLSSPLLGKGKTLKKEKERYPEPKPGNDEKFGRKTTATQDKGELPSSNREVETALADETTQIWYDGAMQVVDDLANGVNDTIAHGSIGSWNLLALTAFMAPMP